MRSYAPTGKRRLWLAVKTGIRVFAVCWAAAVISAGSGLATLYLVGLVPPELGFGIRCGLVLTSAISITGGFVCSVLRWQEYDWVDVDD